MIKKNKWKLIISSIIILLPTLIGFFGDKILPEKIVTHLGLDGKPDGYGSPSTVFFVLPLVLLAIHWSCMILSSVIDRNVEQNKKLMGIVLFIIPTLSLVSCGVIFATALGHTSGIYAVLLLTMAVFFIIIGNYMPKTTRNRTMGIKIRWTLSNDENWNATHRFAGKVFVAAGFLCLLAMPLPSVAFPYVSLGIILLCLPLPVIYSYNFYKKQLADGRVTAEEYKKEFSHMVKDTKLGVVVTVIMLSMLLIFLPIILFTGEMEITLGDNAVTVDATFWQEVSIKYDDIDSIEYREGRIGGTKINGFNSAKLLLGVFNNSEFGSYTRYTYNKDVPCVVLRVNGDIVVLNAESEEAVLEIYNRISAEISE